MQQNIYRATSNALLKAFSLCFKYSTRARQPSIKFLGTRHPQPKFDSSSTSSSSAATSHDIAFGTKTSAISAQSMIEFIELPAKFRRKPISEEEIQIINSGGFRK